MRRFDEDWWVLRGVDLAKTDDFWDRLKFIPLNRDGSVYLTLAAQVRERLEYFYMDYVGRQNIISPSAGISVSPLFTVLAKAAIAIEVGRSRWQVEPGFPGSPLSNEGR